MPFLHNLDFESLGGTQSLSLLAFFFTIVVWHFASRRKTIYDSFPRVKDDALRSIFWPSHVQKLVLRGYHNIMKPTGRPFTVRWWAKDFLILPPEALQALRDADWVHLSFFRTISDAFFLHTSVGDLYDSDKAVQVVRKGLNPRLPQLTPIVEEEIGYALKAELGDKPNGQKKVARDFFTAIVHRSASRILIGDELCRNEGFIRESTGFVMSIFITALAIVKLPFGPLRNWLAYPISRWHRRKLARCTNMLLPVLERRIEEHNSQDKPHEPKLDAIEWFLMLSKPTEVSKQRLAAELMHNLWAGTSAPGGLVTEITFQLLLQPKYKGPLLTEAIEALGNDGRWTEKALSRLPLLDSFIRETNRLNPTGSITCSRTVLDRPFVFPNGLTLPVGTRFGFPTEAMQSDAENSFDGFRFVRTRSAAEANDEVGALGASTTVSPGNLAFGYGTHACPGRFFAIRIVKMVVITLLLNYEVEWDGSINRRPEPMWIEGQYIPNGSQKVKITKRPVPLNESIQA
ncbi:cytochrome P450 [Xylariaceae sp. AK1471]|nr:cytochrome P450 [Xylariaceae sp. AK1471]